MWKYNRTKIFDKPIKYLIHDTSEAIKTKRIKIAICF